MQRRGDTSDAGGVTTTTLRGDTGVTQTINEPSENHHLEPASPSSTATHRCSSGPEAAAVDGQFLRDVWHAYAHNVVTVPANVADVDAWRSQVIIDARQRWAADAAAIKLALPDATAYHVAAALHRGAPNEITAEQMEYERISKAWRTLAAREDVPGSYAAFKRMLAEPKPSADVRIAGLDAARAALPEEAS